MLGWIFTSLAVGHLSWVLFAGVFRPEHALADALLLVLGWAPFRNKAYARAGLAVWLTGVLLDNQPLFINSLRGTVHTGDLWAHEASLFGRVWAEYFWSHATSALDAICGLGYAIYLPEYFAVMIAFFVMKSVRAERMAWTFLALNAVGVLIYVLYPAAPPWYVMAHGPGPADLAARGSAAGAARFDALFGIHFFREFYARNPNPFGAMPSLHTAYPTAVTWQVWSRGNRWRIPAALFAGLIGFSAVYLSHHYILDVLAGAAVALAVCAALDGLARFFDRRNAVNEQAAPVAAAL